MAITEGTINGFLTKLFLEEGFSTLSEYRITGTKQPDHQLEYNGVKIISETEVGEFFRKFTESKKQLINYDATLQWGNTMALIFPDDSRMQMPLSEAEEWLKALMGQIRLRAYIEIPGKIVGFKEGNIFEIISELKKELEVVEVEEAFDFDSVVKVLRGITEEFSLVLRTIKLGDQLYNTPVGSFDLFSAIADEDEDILKVSSVDLAAYIFINQLLFYKIFSEHHKNLPRLAEIENLDELNARYDKIKEIDFKAIYGVDIISILPRIKLIVEEVNKVIGVIDNLPFEQVKHDILGRFFHDLLPHDTRKVLAAFYTRPQSAEMLAALTIDHHDEHVIDPACGSGTLLVSAYRRKAKLSGKKLSEVHTGFIEEDIFGIDIMPFAVHLTALNLTMQDLDSITDYTQTAISDSLIELPVKSARKTQRTLPGLMDALTHQSLDSTEKKEKISFEPHSFDSVIMNPPFTKTERMKDYAKKVQKAWKEWGGGVGLWGSFIGLAFDYLADPKKGKVGAVIPIAIFRGRESKELREKVFSPKSKIRVRCVVKALSNLAFSESSAFRDILIVFENNSKREQTAFVFVKNDLDKMKIEKARQIGQKIKNAKEGIDFEDKDIIVSWVPWNKLVEDRSNLMPYVNIIKPSNRRVLFDFFDMLDNKEKFELASEKLILEGWGPRPKGINKLVLVTRPSDPSRLKFAFLVLKEDDPKSKSITVGIKDTDIEYKIPRASVVRSLRTATGINRMRLAESDMDYIITEPFKGFDELFSIVNPGWEMDWERLNRELLVAKTRGVIVNRVRFNSDNTALLALNNGADFYPTNQLKLINHENSIAIGLLFNSILSVSQFFGMKEDTTENFIHIHGQDVACIYLPNFEKLSKRQVSDIEGLWDSLKDKEFPSLLTQMKEASPVRLKLDHELFEILGIRYDLKKLYRAVAEEIERNVGVK